MNENQLVIAKANEILNKFVPNKNLKRSPLEIVENLYTNPEIKISLQTEVWSADKPYMKTGQVFKAKDAFELYGRVKSQVQFSDFHPRHFTIFHFTKISETEYMIDDSLYGNSHDQTQNFIAKFPDYDMFCGVDGTTTHNRFSFGCQELYATVVYTEYSSWTEVYEDHKGNPIYEEYMHRQASGFIVETKKIAS